MRLLKILTETTDLAVREEYWVEADGSLIPVNGSLTHHEDVVMERIIDQFCDIIGVKNIYDGDAVWFRTDVYDMEDPDDPDADKITDAADAMIANGLDSEMVAQMRSLVGGNTTIDARGFAIRFWSWLRVSQANAEVLKINSKTLKRLGEAYADIFFEEHGEEPDHERVVHVSEFFGTKHLSVQYGDLLDGNSGNSGDAAAEALKKAGRAQVEKMDAAVQHPFYSGRSSGG